MCKSVRRKQTGINKIEKQCEKGGDTYAAKNSQQIHERTDMRICKGSAFQTLRELSNAD